MSCGSVVWWYVDGDARRHGQRCDTRRQAVALMWAIPLIGGYRMRIHSETWRPREETVLHEFAPCKACKVPAPEWKDSAGVGRCSSCFAPYLA